MSAAAAASQMIAPTAKTHGDPDDITMMPTMATASPTYPTRRAQTAILQCLLFCRSGGSSMQESYRAILADRKDLGPPLGGAFGSTGSRSVQSNGPRRCSPSRERRQYESHPNPPGRPQPRTEPGGPP